MKSQNAEKICRSCYFAILLREIILQKSKENIIPDTRAQIVEKVCTPEIDCVGICAEPAAIIDGDIHPA